MQMFIDSLQEAYAFIDNGPPLKYHFTIRFTIIIKDGFKIINIYIKKTQDME